MGAKSLRIYYQRITPLDTMESFPSLFVFNILHRRGGTGVLAARRHFTFVSMKQQPDLSNLSCLRQAYDSFSTRAATACRQYLASL
jgi:hypothetical protein